MKLEARVQGAHSVARPSVPAFTRAAVGFASPGLFTSWASQAEGSEDDPRPSSVPAPSRTSLRVPKVPQSSDPLKAARSLGGQPREAGHYEDERGAQEASDVDNPWSWRWSGQCHGYLGAVVMCFSGEKGTFAV